MTENSYLFFQPSIGDEETHEIADRIRVIEDAAHKLRARYKGGMIATSL